MLWNQIMLMPNTRGQGKATQCTKFLTLWSRPRLYRLQTVEGKGVSLVATRHLPAGEKILEETPILQGETEKLKDSEYVTFALSQLSKMKRKKFGRLYNAYPEQKKVGIINTNCYALGCDGPRSGIFEKLSSINHSCTPNAERWWDPGRGIETLYAIRALDEGEEITVAYTWTAARRWAERQRLLFSSWRFTCNCECCQLTGTERESSDKCRQLIRKADVMVGFHSTTEVLPLIKESLKCCEKERLFGTVCARICYDEYQLALQTENLREATKFIKWAYEQYLLGTGPGSNQTKKMAAYVQDPTSHSLWNP